MSNAAPGWYPDETGRQRWWDGSQWGGYAASPLVYAQVPQQVTIVRAPTNGLAVASMVIGISATVLSWTIILLFFTVPASLIGLILGILGLNTARKMDGRGKGMAITGIVLCALPFVIGGILIIMSIAGVIASGASNPSSY